MGRRLRGKGPIVRGAGEAIGVDVPQTSRKAVHAPDGMVCMASEPPGNLILGQEVSLNVSVDIQVGDRTAFLKREDDWVKAELIRVEDCGDCATRRRLLFKLSRARAPSCFKPA